MRSQIVVTAMEILWSSYVLVVLFSVDAVCSHKHSKEGLSCVNDFINNVSCTWNGSPLAPGTNCSVSGVKPIRSGKERLIREMIRSCKLEQHGNTFPGCSFVFENKVFNRFKDLSYISMTCDGKLVENITNYEPCKHIKMHPPGVPSVNLTANETLISWTAGSPLSKFIRSFYFQLQIKQISQTWQEARYHHTYELKLKLPSLKLSGHHQVRVRVYPNGWSDSHWSNWSPATSWVGATDKMTTSPDAEWLQTLLVTLGGVFIFCLFFVMLVLCRSCVEKWPRKKRPVPNPSKYFHTLHSVHGGNLKKWLNPPSAPDSFFTAQPHDHISPVELCDSADVVPSTSPSSSSTSAQLHFKSYPMAVSDTSGVVYNSFSSSSSCFSNKGYFLSSSSGGSALTDPSPAYFTYQDDFHNLHSGPNLHLFCPSINTFPTYESLKREPQSPDSGIGIREEDEEEKEDKRVVDVEEDEVSDDQQTSPLLILPLHLPSQMCPPSSPPPSPPSLTQVSSDSHQVNTPVAAASGGYAAWPLAGAMCRSSSMPVEPCRTGYLTLKELQTTFSNKSI